MTCQEMIEQAFSDEALAAIPAEEIPKLITALSSITIRLTTRLGRSALSPAVPHGTASNTEDRLISVEEAATRLGFSKDWIYRKAKAGKLPFTVRLENRVRFSANGIDRYIVQRKWR